MNKKIVFVGGTAYSGSTLLCLTLANDEHGFASGEVNNAFYPTLPGHRNYLNKCTCGEHPCPIWQEAVAAGAKDIYSELFRVSPDSRLIVDSSKGIFWIKAHQDHLSRQQEIEVKHLLVWKHPSQLKKSYEKRGHGEKWLPDWVMYHRLYLTLLKPDLTVSYAEYTEDPGRVLDNSCEALEIPNFPEKREYWNREHHALGGNPSARIHLYDSKSELFESAKKRIRDSDTEGQEQHKEIYSVASDSDEELLRDSPIATKLFSFLKAGAPQEDVDTLRELKLPASSVAIRKLKHHAWRRLGLWRYR